MDAQSPPTPDVSIIVPALNEEQTIQAVLDRLLALPLSMEILVVNDGSDDKTGEILSGFGDKIRVLTNAKRGGKGNAIRQALVIATGRIVVIQDADLEYVPEELPALLEPILSGRTRVAYGSRFMKGAIKGMALPNRIVNVLLVWAVAILYGRKVTDEATCYKALDRGLLMKMNLQCERFEFCPEVTAKAFRLGEKIEEVPISYVPRNKLAGKKIRWTDAPEAFWTLLKYRWWKG